MWLVPVTEGFRECYGRAVMGQARRRLFVVAAFMRPLRAERLPRSLLAGELVRVRSGGAGLVERGRLCDRDHGRVGLAGGRLAAHQQRDGDLLAGDLDVLADGAAAEWPGA